MAEQLPLSTDKKQPGIVPIEGKIAISARLDDHGITIEFLDGTSLRVEFDEYDGWSWNLSASDQQSA